MNNELWARELQRACGNRDVVLPTARDLRVTGARGAVELHLSADAVCKNMQKDAAAFEGWALALLTWGDAGRITLAWDEPPEPDHPHYARFLYRVERFCAVEPCVTVQAGRRTDEWTRRHGHKRCVLNVARGKDTATPAANTEAALEMRIATLGTAEHRNLGVHANICRVARQIPVGLFHGKVSGRTAIFPGGKAAIDLLVMEADGTLCVVELKLKDRPKVGAVSELFFYTMVIQDLRAGRMHVDGKPGPRVSVTTQDILSARAIRGLLLMEGGGAAPAVHSLVQDRVLPRLSERVGIDYRWAVLG